MKIGTFKTGFVRTFVCGTGLLVAGVAVCQPFVPKDGSQVLEHLRATAFDPAEHQLREVRRRLSAEPGNLTLACDFARQCLERSRAEADPRYLGRAQAALEPWWSNPAPPADVLVLRATLKQSQHDFNGALADLKLAGEITPRNAQVWLTRSTILTVLGDYAAARRACVPLAQLAPGLVSLTAAANVACLNGEAKRGCELLHRALDENPKANASERIWALTVLAEAEERLGNFAEAEADFKRALAMGQRDPYLLGAYADLLIEQGRPSEAVSLLKDETRADGLLLRLTLAESALVPRPPSYSVHVSALEARFEAGHLRGDFVHQREEARFKLRLQGEKEEALRLAQANWAVQHEPADLHLLLESAIAAGDPEAAKPALEFVAATHLEDVELSKMALQVAHK